MLKRLNSDLIKIHIYKQPVIQIWQKIIIRTSKMRHSNFFAWLFMKDFKFLRIMCQVTKLAVMRSYKSVSCDIALHKNDTFK